MGFTAADIPDLAGKVAVITGANTGVGYQTALEMARKGAHVILACRSAERAQPAVETIKKETNSEKVEFMELDLSSLKSVERFAEAFRGKGLPLNTLVLNAGIMAVPYELSGDGIESQFATNHVGHFYLTQLLFDLVESSQPSRVVCLTSSAHNMAPSEGVCFSKINDQSVYAPWTAYGQSKLSNLLFARELSRRCEGKQIFVNAVHPGFVDTELQRYYTPNSNIFAKWGLRFATWAFSLTPQQGALTQLYAATHPDIERKRIVGQYFVPIAKIKASSALANDKELAGKLWTFTEELLKEKVGEGYKSKL